MVSNSSGPTLNAAASWFNEILMAIPLPVVADVPAILLSGCSLPPHHPR
ncbi:hypothetical protein [Dickeya zeae]|nr:hypothetical protein [Dickeya zeae]UJR56704.1 hypothetical protein HJ580_09745 [Dickeya zeae]